MKWKYFYYVAFLSVVVMAAEPVTASGFRCGNKLVHLDDTKETVAYKCGDPDSVEIWTEEQTTRYPYRKRWEGKKYGPTRSRYVAKKIVTVEKWTYNLGSNRFMRFLKFENGTLRKIDTGQYGY